MAKASSEISSGQISGEIGSAQTAGEQQHEIAITQVTEDSRMSLGQRRINLVWEMTQAIVVIGIVGVGMVTSMQLALRNDERAATSFLLISNAVFLTIGFYFGRTNHQRVGGVGSERFSGR